MVRGSIQPLIDKLTRQAAARRQNDRIFVEHTNNLARLSPREPISVTREELDAMKAYKAAIVKFAQSLVTKPPVVEPGMPLLKSSSILSVHTPPYTDRWTDGTGASANQVSGTWSTQCRGSGHSYAGVCTFFSPQQGRFPVRFAPVYAAQLQLSSACPQSAGQKIPSIQGRVRRISRYIRFCLERESLERSQRCQKHALESFTLEYLATISSPMTPRGARPR